MESLASLGNKSPANTQFHFSVSPGSMSMICKGVVPAIMKTAMSWALCVFEEWRKECNKAAKTPAEKCPMTPLEKPDVRSGFVGS